MHNSIKLTKSDVSFLKYTSPGKYYPKSVSYSEDGYLVMHQRDSIVIGTIGFQPSNQNQQYALELKPIKINLKQIYPLSVKDFDFENAIQENKIKEETIYQLSLCVNYTTSQFDETNDFIRVDWSPLDTIINKSYLAIMNFDGRIILMGQNRMTNIWENEFDMLEVYHEFYKGNLLNSYCDENGLITCTDVNKYIQVKNDLKLTSFSWSSVVRQSDQSQYCLIALLSDSGIVTVWRIINNQLESRCEIIHCYRLNEQHGVPKTIQFCDISNDFYLISVFYSNEKIIAYPYQIIDEDNKVSVENFPNFVTINDQVKYTHVNKVFWSMKQKTLIVGYESELLFAKIECTNEHDINALVYWLELPSTDEISGIVVKENMVYVTTRDGCLFAIKFDLNTENIELNEINFESPELNGNVDFLSVFISPNGVHLGFVKIDCNQLLKQNIALTVSDIVLIQIMPEKELLFILMDDNKPFSRKQDAVEELRHLYFNNKINYHVALQKLLRFGEDDEEKSLYNLQLARYVCMFFGYPLNRDHEVFEWKYRNLKISKIRELETIIISRNISYWLEGFCELATSDTDKDDCFFVLSVSVKLKLISTNSDILEAIEAAQNRSRSLLTTEFGVHSSDIENFESLNQTVICPFCKEKCQFNLFTNKCSQNHSIPRCCKSLELCEYNFKLCSLCGAHEVLIDAKGTSNWRLDIINSNCPLCDGKFT